MSVAIEAQAEPIPGYRLLDRLGSGGFGEVWRCEAPGGIFKAVKIIFGDLRSQNNDLIRYAEQELKALKRVKMVRHPYLLALDRYDIVEGRLMIVMELADCNLWDRFRECRDKGLPGIPRDELLMYMAEAAEVLDLMDGKHDLQHLDIKPQNLFMLHNHVKVADFGQVKDLQGVMASVTGGITPVYAAPETFDGMVSRYCDQYSLACVYQELLTGQRPFDGSSMSQLLMQHLQLPPNLQPSPSCDRAALSRALSKKPEDRWPNVSSFVRALRESGSVGRVSGVSTMFAQRPLPEDLPPTPAIHGGALPDDTPFPKAIAETESSYQPVFTPAPPEVSGDGPLRPSLIIGIGQSGLRVLQRLRFDLTERYGPQSGTPLVRTLYIDTDADALDEATRTRLDERLAALHPDDIFAAKLNRAGHYLKPRLNGRSLIEGWFDQQLLYKIPRTPSTMGLRLLGRLAFCDHYRPLMGKIHAELESCLAPDSLHLTEQRTGLRRRTNRPRVYVVAGIAGGTGGGMFLDVAYTVRARLKRMGYENPEVVGVLIVPPADAMLTPPQALGNTYASLTELNHYTRSQSVFTANYDDRNGAIKEKDAPFTRCILLPGSAAGLQVQKNTPAGSGVVPVPRSHASAAIPIPAARMKPPGSGISTKPGSRVIPCVPVRVEDTAQSALKPYADAADLLRLELFAPIGRTTDAIRAERSEPASGVTFSAFGLASFDWPRAEVVTRTTSAVVRTILKNWTVPNVKRAREVIPGWAAAHWTQLGLEPDAILAHFQTVMEQTLGGRIEELITLTTEPLVPRGWMARLPEPDKVNVAMDRIVKMFGPPASPAKRELTPGEAAVSEAAQAAAEGFTVELSVLGHSLVEDPQFRLAGAEEALRQFLATTDRVIGSYLEQATAADAKAVAGYELLAQYTHFQKGMRKPTAAEITEALRQFPRSRYQAFVHRKLYEVYRAVREVLANQLANVAEAKMRMEAAASHIDDEPLDLIPGPRRLMPPGCLGVADAVARFLAVMQDEDYLEIDRKVQSALEPEIGGLFQACLNSSGGAEGAMHVLREEARTYLDNRLGEVDLAAMFAERFRSKHLAEQGMNQAFAEAEPDWVGNGPWAGSELVVASAPDGPGGTPIRELLTRAIPVAGLPIAESRDDVTIYREYPNVPLSVVPHLGPAGEQAYKTLPEANQCSMHSRLDITQWANVDAD
ncbi:MAG: tubulin-like doman-containing protein [Gemmataceae bacterium]